VAELGVVPDAAHEGVLREALDRDRIAKRLGPPLCGDAAACAAVQALVRDTQATELTVDACGAWGLDAVDAARACTLAVVRVVVDPSPQALALRTAFATAGALALELDGNVVDRVLGRVEDAEMFRTHAIVEPLVEATFRADRVRVTEAPGPPGTVGLRTAGLIRWGAPDVDVVSVPEVAREPMTALVLAVAASLAGGAEVTPVAISRNSLGLDAGQTALDDASPAAPPPLILIELADAPHEAGTEWVARIEPPGGEGPASTLELAEGIFGPLLARAPDERTKKARANRSREALDRWLSRSGPREGGTLRVRLPFAIPGGGFEALWVDVEHLDERTLTGRIADDPLAATDVTRGDEVTRPRAEVEEVSAP
jgi:hypothetical protein